MAFSAAIDEVYRDFTKYYREVTAKKIIEKPLLVDLPVEHFVGQLDWNGSGESQTNFLWFAIPLEQIDKWAYRGQLSFAYSPDQGLSWYQLPQLTVWEHQSNDKKAKFGLYSAFVQRFQDEVEGFRFRAWFN